MSNRSLIEINHDYAPRADEYTDLGRAIHNFIRSGESNYLPRGYSFISTRHHTEQSEVERLKAENAELRALLSTSDVVNAPKTEALARRLERIHKAVYESDWNTIYEIAEGADIRASTIAEIQRLCEAKAKVYKDNPSTNSMARLEAILLLDNFARELGEMK